MPSSASGFWTRPPSVTPTAGKLPAVAHSPPANPIQDFPIFPAPVALRPALWNKRPRRGVSSIAPGTGEAEVTRFCEPVRPREEITAAIPRLRRYALALTGNRVQAEDLVQDTLERALSRFHLWRRGSNLRAWLFTIMHNLHANHVRDSQRAQKAVLEQDAAQFSTKATQEVRLEVHKLQIALKKLSYEQREVLLLVALEEMTYQDVSRVLGIPIGTVMSRLARGRERLRAIVREESGAAQLKVLK